ncbi:MAG: lysylphosphatidylglycerol synthase domain-containing protein, partial [Deltaproteobacteria bacterium]|nr:lysylphosphatidylglycerol synthase domain-containing protein [Deltaproteobacteria bacterium]
TAVRMLLIQPVMYFICFKACGTHIPLTSLILISNILTAVSLIPITAQGLGVVEISAVYLFSLIHVNESTTVAIYLISRPLYFIFSGLLLLFTGALWDILYRRDIFFKKC